jgi:hypothetical protein
VCKKEETLSLERATNGTRGRRFCSAAFTLIVHTLNVNSHDVNTFNFGLFSFPGRTNNQPTVQRATVCGSCFAKQLFAQ